MQNVLAMISIIMLIGLPIIFIFSEVKSGREFRKLIEQLKYEDMLNEISRIVKDKKETKTSKLEKIEVILNLLKDLQKDV
ncbi:hypothetical protein J6W34_01160 [bacterium]|nr:hypothetical protein [bacterium]